MHKGFNLQLEDSSEWLRWKSKGDALFELDNQTARAAIESYVTAGVIDGKRLQSHWFAQKKADVFISHSHKDESLAIAIAGWLHDRFGLYAFVDSCVWGYANDLQRELDLRYCKKLAPQTTYDYHKRNRTTSHVHMMLSTALTDMIDHAECFIFLHTDESVVRNSIKTTVGHPTTTSPWIYAELAASRVIRKRPTGRSVPMRKRAMESAAMDELEIEYPAHLAHLHAINDSALKEWGRCGKRKYDALDELYWTFS